MIGLSLFAILFVVQGAKVDLHFAVVTAHGGWCVGLCVCFVGVVCCDGAGVRVLLWF